MELKNKRWNFTFATAAGVTEDGYSYASDWGWNSVMAKTKKLPLKRPLSGVLMLVKVNGL